MRIALSPDNGKDAAPKGNYSRWAHLPGVCCQAAGGDPRWADDIAAAWLMFYLAADLMDSVEDQDASDPWWAELGPSAALNVASGLFFSASLALNSLYDQNRTKWNASQLVAGFHKCFLRMCSGQHVDLMVPEPNLELYWKVAEAKSGSFFAFACWAGACLATEDPGKQADYKEFGNQIGLLVQIMDDLEELQVLQEPNSQVNARSFFQSLPVVYALDVLSPTDRTYLSDCLRHVSSDPVAAETAFKMIEQSGVILYLLTVLEQHQNRARRSLERAKPQSAAKHKLNNYMQSLSLVL